MSEASSVEEILGKAKEEEGRYEWLKAADCYQQALTAVAEADFLRKGEISERLAYAVYRAAFQAENSNEFKARMQLVVEEYGKTKQFYAMGVESKTPQAFRCDAMIALADHWIASEASERKRLLEECWKLAKTALDSFSAAKNQLEYGETFAHLSIGLWLDIWFLDDNDTEQNMVNDGVKYGEQAVECLSHLGDSFKLARVYAQTAIYLEMFGIGARDPAEKGRFCQKALSYLREAKRLSEEAALLESYWQLGFDFGSEESIAILARTLDYSSKARDRFMIGWALDLLSANVAYRVPFIEDVEERGKLLIKSLDYAEKARNEFGKLAWISPYLGGSFWAEAPHTEYFRLWASDETDLSRRRALLQKAIESAPDGFERAELSGNPNPIMYMHDRLSRALSSLAKTETDLNRRRKILEEALEHRNESSISVERNSPFIYVDVGNQRNQLADIKYQIADLTADSDKRKEILREAIRYKEDAVSFYLKDLSGIRSDDKALFGRLGSIQFEYGEMLNKLYELTGDREHAANALEAFRQAAENFRKLNLVSRSAECRWRSAQAYDALGEYSKAADDFALASEDYKEAALRIPKLKDFYKEHSNYMQAWSEIEKGRYSHEQQEYGLAASNFETAGGLYKSSQRWSYLAANYAAWSKVEHAEESSIDEHDEEAFEGFRQSADLFQEAGRSIQSKLGRIEDSNEEQMARDMLKATELRREYCEARMAIEKARIFSKKGEHNASIQQYGLSIEILETVIEKLESKIDKRECQFIICLSRAWQEMEKAEAEESPQHYDEANQLFEKAKDLAQTEKAKALVLGHSRFCKALEAGAKFADTRDMSEHARAMQHLESATNYYLKADFQKASEYTRATRLLFDAYVHMGNAARETDPEKKTRLYMVAEKVLQTSADSYARAGNLSKRKQTLKLLETAQDQREIAISLAEILQAPIMASATAFTVPTSSSEKAVGLEKFEHAEINANMILGRSEYRVGENIDLEIELANAGKGQALLTQIEEAFPESFDLTTKPESYRVEGHNINMKGRRLDPLKTEEVKFSVKPKHKGSFTVRPRILYLDENGNAKSHQTKSLTITVKELGISGWIKGER